MDVCLFDYDLPPSLIAQEPAEPRDASRLLVLDRAGGGWEDRRFGDLPALLRTGDCLVLNDSRVIPARLLGTLSGGESAELLLIREVGAERWTALARPARRCRAGARIVLADGAARATVIAERESGTRIVAIESPWPVRELLERHGLPPLPPYIERHRSPKPEDWERYQTVYAREDGSVAAPTAGLHFSGPTLSRLAVAGAETHVLTLHVGPGTFRPIRTREIEAHSIDSERVSIPAATTAGVERARAEGRRVIAVGTTTTRALEWWAASGAAPGPIAGEADLFIRPGHRFAVVDGMVTNFHLPRSSLLVLVAALAGREPVLAAYRHAVEAGYRFYSYGDAMLVV